MMKNTLPIYGLFVVALLVASNLSAQISGYQGKRSVFTYNMTYFPALTSPNANNNSGFAAFNIGHIVKGEWILTRKSSFGLQSRFYKATANFNDENISYNARVTDQNGNFVSTNPNAVYTVPFDEESGALSGFSVGMFYRFYGSKSLAPLGNYFQMSLESMSYKVTPNGQSLSNQNNVRLGGIFGANLAPGQVATLPDVQEDSRWNAIAFSFDFGRQRVIFDRLVWNIGIQNSYIIAGNGVSGLQQVFVEDAFGREYEEEEYLATRGRRRLSGLLFLNIYMGIGFLAI